MSKYHCLHVWQAILPTFNTHSMVTIIPKTGCDGRYSFPGLADTLKKINGISNWILVFVNQKHSYRYKNRNKTMWYECILESMCFTSRKNQHTEI